MSYFTAKMHQIRFRLGLRPRPRWGAHSAPRDPLAGFKGPTSKGRGEQGRVGQGRGMGRKGRKGEAREGRRGGMGRKGRGKVASWLLGDGRPWHVMLAWYCYRNFARPSVRLSVRPSVTLMYPRHIGWTSSKLITRIISLGSSLLCATTSAI